MLCLWNEGGMEPITGEERIGSTTLLQTLLMVLVKPQLIHVHVLM